jgi:hypothetical protein
LTKPIQETFLELDWEDADMAKQARDSRAAELQAQGLVCTCENLYNVSGYRVFLLEAREAESVEIRPVAKDGGRPSLRPKRSSHSPPSFEER